MDAKQIPNIPDANLLAGHFPAATHNKLVYGATSNAKDCIFMMIDEEGKLYVSNLLSVEDLRTPDQAALHNICRVIVYALLQASFEDARSFNLRVKQYDSPIMKPPNPLK